MKNTALATADKAHMGNELQKITEQDVLGKRFTIYGTIENPLFLAKDVAEWIEYDLSSVNKMIASVDDDEKTTRKINPNGTNYQTEAWFLTEDGLYEVLMQSRKPIAKQFKKKVKEILKDIRRHGIYATDKVIDDILNNPDFGIEEIEEWKDICGYDGKYMVSNLGRVKSLNYRNTQESHLLRQTVGNRGYLHVTLSKNGRYKPFLVHRLVAKAFIPNPNNLPTVNHLDECKTNNRFNNLEWSSYRENNLYGNHYKRVSESQRNDPKKSKRIAQYDLLGNFIKEWESAQEIQRKLQINNSNVIQNCKGNVKSAGGFIWKYAI